MVQLGRTQRVFQRVHLTSEDGGCPFGATASLTDRLGGTAHVERDGDRRLMGGRTWEDCRNSVA